MDPTVPGSSHFTVRARWADASSITYRIDEAGSAVAVAAFRGAIERAVAIWCGAGSVSLTEALPEEDADVSFSWRSGAHDNCEPFGISTARAHTGRLAEDTFVHFDGGRNWSAAGGDSLSFVALHEVGHVLGLGHSAAPGALLGPDVRGGTLELTASELAGLHSLYGGGQDDPSDLLIVDGADSGGIETGTTILRRVAPRGITGMAVIDSDGDGDEELLVWRTDRGGNGALMIYHFDSDLRLALTVGPLYGMSAPGVPNLFVYTVTGERLMVCVYEGGRLLTRRFNEKGLLEPRPEGLPLVVEGGIRDADGDGLLDEDIELVSEDASRVSGDLDGDRRQDAVVRFQK